MKITDKTEIANTLLSLIDSVTIITEFDETTIHIEMSKNVIIDNKLNSIMLSEGMIVIAGNQEHIHPHLNKTEMIHDQDGLKQRLLDRMAEEEHNNPYNNTFSSCDKTP